MEKQLYHILTPVPPENLRVVNCLLLGNIAIPSCVLLNQVRGICMGRFPAKMFINVI